MHFHTIAPTVNSNAHSVHIHSIVNTFTHIHSLFQQGEGEIWVSNTRFTADGAPVQSPSDTTRSPFGAPMESLGGFPRRRATNGSDYKMVTNATPKPPAPMPPRSTTAPLQAAGLGGKGRGDAQGAGQGASQ